MAIFSNNFSNKNHVINHRIKILFIIMINLRQFAFSYYSQNKYLYKSFEFIKIITLETISKEIQKNLNKRRFQKNLGSFDF